MKLFCLTIGIGWILSSYIWFASYIKFEDSAGLYGAIFSFAIGVSYIFIGAYYK